MACRQSEGFRAYYNERSGRIDRIRQASSMRYTPVISKCRSLDWDLNCATNLSRNTKRMSASTTSFRPWRKAQNSRRFFVAGGMTKISRGRKCGKFVWGSTIDNAACDGRGRQTPPGLWSREAPLDSEVLQVCQWEHNSYLHTHLQPRNHHDSETPLGKCREDWWKQRTGYARDERARSKQVQGRLVEAANRLRKGRESTVKAGTASGPALQKGRHNRMATRSVSVPISGETTASFGTSNGYFGRSDTGFDSKSDEIGIGSTIKRLGHLRFPDTTSTQLKPRGYSFSSVGFCF